ncbi:MAG: hypothetical protein A3I77_04370 [Gammaproteobacteria bacterium RIFCSPLOWO2_02_FULL_42_14]|nr:MAG: hypothetical protein A3B71_05670 [Gammaproteobacteria bacterium RIFCSPHIGHO2_02_FULL_42_43]OGT28440.1 MAG: hypothetical protein A2624_01175 [Gammaproteobacteria bacterium RIFCSPHIGHO2_01_FULL_42_8]OGT51480.1 MAG: hypothetical protein A3E54_05435 [Gammaproteobacteria bacterium RIFCSPHIGHO2_12_FULL_41_25]OGT62181.1 MAG: hypothetical protein A3I77_04370 [Gammaproteobacteria bacterium RIFCSPLOWO2_02_FULL_42_14]OGT85854.1 MAG: hypothetical protein A3G86_04060 [Gammaproteobacteria bacterium R
MSERARSHIVLITDSYPPEIRSASHLMLELADELLRRGFQVTVVTSWPQYNLDDTAMPQFQECMNERGIRVIRMKHLPHHNVPFFIRGIAQLILPYLFIRKIKQYVHEKIDSVMVYSPPLPLAFVGAWVKKKYHARYFLNIQDLFPHNAIDLGVLNNKILIAFFRWMERKAYQQADVITTHSQGNQQLLSELYPEFQRKITVLHNWVDIEAHRVAVITKNYRELFGLHDKLIIVFAGVIGPSQYLKIIIEAAKQLQSLPKLCFLIVGDGTEKKTLEALTQQHALNNVIFKPFISRELYPQLLASCDIGLVCLSPKNKTPVVPGKILGYMAAQLPVLAILHHESDAHQMIQDAQCGYSALSDDFPMIIRTIENCYHNKHQHKTMGLSGYEYAKKYFSKEHCVDQLLKT